MKYDSVYPTFRLAAQARNGLGRELRRCHLATCPICRRDLIIGHGNGHTLAGNVGLPVIRDRVKPGLAVAGSKGKSLGRPRKIVDARRIAALRAQGVGWKRIASEMGVAVGTIYRVAQAGPKLGKGILERNRPSPSPDIGTSEVRKSAAMHGGIST